MIERTERLIKLISSNFFKLEIQGLIISVNALSVSLDTQIPNSNLWIQRKGSAKSHFLKILSESNSDYFVRLPDKFFETSILEDFDSEWFTDKVWIHDDLIILFHGLTSKQRQQLMGFFVEFLSSGYYERRDRSKERIKRVEGRISCVFPISQENYSRYGKELFYQTLTPERLVPIGYDFSAEDMRKASEIRLEREERNNPSENIRIDLPFSDEKVRVKLSREYHRDISDMAMRLQLLIGLSATRGVMYISNFLRSHALLNDRDEVSREDIEILSLILPAHSEPRESLESEIRRYIFNQLLEKEEVRSTEIYERFRDYTDRAIRKALISIRRDCPYKRGEKDEIIFYI